MPFGGNPVYAGKILTPTSEDTLYILKVVHGKRQMADLWDHLFYSYFNTRLNPSIS
jgi:hypothetical protein